MFRHPKYYKELRKRNKLDQAISSECSDGCSERAPGPGPKPSHKLQAPSLKLQAQIKKNSKPQAPSSKLQASSRKLQAP